MHPQNAPCTQRMHPPHLTLKQECGNTGSGKRKSAKYMDGMFKNCVVAPAEVKAKGMEFFDDNEDLKTAEKLISAIEQFLRS